MYLAFMKGKVLEWIYFQIEWGCDAVQRCSPTLSGCDISLFEIQWLSPDSANNGVSSTETPPSK